MKKINEYSRTYYQKNKKRLQDYSREYQRARKDQRRGQHYNQKYGLSLEEVEKLLQQQNSLCAICNQPPVGQRKLCVDHCHTTGQVRGLLCLQCNTTLGFLEKRNIDPSFFITQLIQYQHKVQNKTK